MRVIERQPVVSGALASSTVPETDYAAWSNTATYGLEDRVIKTATHRIYESAVAGNIGHDPATDTINWIDVGPTNRWAMFDAAGGQMTTYAGTIVMNVAIADTAQSLGLVDLQAGSVSLHVVSGGVGIGDEVRSTPGSAEIFSLPAGTGRTFALTITPSGGLAIVGKLVIGATLDLGDTEDAPTIGITDYSRRTTDDFGVTTVAKRSYAKRLTARCRIDSVAVDGVERRLAALRASPALWIGDATNPGLVIYGVFKEFSVDLQIGSTTFCSLTVDGLTSPDLAITVIDPAVEGSSSNFRALRPLTVTDAVLSASNVLEDDYSAWGSGTTYTLGARAISTATHRIYESLIDENIGHNPTTDSTRWLDVGPTNRWAMFDQALGTATERATSLALTLIAPAALTALAAIDLSAGTVRVQAPSYDQTKTVAGGDGNGAYFLDMAVASGANVTITVTAAAGVPLASIGTLLIGTIEPLGTTQTSPTVGINDFSVKTTDDFGNTTLVERAWAKRMELKSLLSSTAIDNVIRRLASLRATPTLWIGDDGFDSLAIYGFFRDFSVAVSERTSVCSLTIEGLSKAAPAVPVPAAPMLITLTASSQQVRYNTNNAFIAGQSITFATARQNSSATPLFHFFAAAGSDLGELDAATWAATYPTLFSTTGPDNFTVLAGQVNNLISNYGAFSVEARLDGTTIKARASVAKVRDGAAGAPGAPGTNGTDGVDGTDGLPGAPGANGVSTYIHVAYSNAADGSSGFTTGAPGSRTYIGILVDNTIADSTTASDYAWSLIKGADGANGTPGAPGANGDPSYVHIAYATAADGSTGFSTTVSSGKTYIGVYTDFTLADSTTPSDYIWSLIKGADGTTPTTVTLDKAVVSVAADATNATKAGSLPKNIKILVDKGGSDLTSTATVGLTTSSAAVVASYSYGSGVGTISITQADTEGKVFVTTTIGGVQIGPILEISITRPQDPLPPQSTTEVAEDFVSGSDPGTSYANQGDTMILKANGSGQIKWDVGLDYTVFNFGSGSKSGTYQITMAWRIPGGSWSYPTGITGSNAVAGPFDQGDGAAAGSGTISSLTAGAAYELQPAVRRSAGLGGSTFSMQGQGHVYQ